jgi:hypothetical protein
MPNQFSRRNCIRGSDARIAIYRDQPLAGMQDPNCWYWTITDRVPWGLYVAAVCCATAVILVVSSWPWGFLLMLLLFPIRNERVCFYAFPTVAARESMRRRESYRRGSPT